jgi:hypothetical protein
VRLYRLPTGCQNRCKLIEVPFWRSCYSIYFDNKVVLILLLIQTFNKVVAIFKAEITPASLEYLYRMLAVMAYMVQELRFVPRFFLFGRVSVHFFHHWWVIYSTAWFFF